MSPIEKLARDICWAEFVGKPPGGRTKAAYWKNIHPDARAVYIQNARYWVAIAKKMKPLRLFAQVVEVIGAPGPGNRP